MHQEFMAFVADEGSYNAARDAARARGYPAGVVQQGGLELLGDMLETDAPPRILLLDLDSESDILTAAQRAVSLCGPDCKLILTARQNDVGLYRQLLQLGISDYLVKPLFEETLIASLISAGKQIMGDKPVNTENRQGGVIPVIGLRGGVGASFVTVNLAWLLAHKLERYVGVVDLDVHFGTVALALDQEAGTGLRAALENPERLDALLIASSLVEESDRLSLLTTEEDIDNPLPFDGEAALALIKPIAKDFDFIFVDAPRSQLIHQKRLLADAQAIILVVDLTLASLRDARRVRQFLKTLRPDLLPLIVANRTGDSASATIDQETFEKNLEAKIDVLLPEEIKTAKQSANLGKAVAEIAPDSIITKNLTRLARQLAGIKDEKTKKASGASLFKNLLGNLQTKPNVGAEPKPAT